ncbi:MAG: alpha/beta hydrolase, partial [Erysipelotrichaceae bacterium]|nr:alpha/beta hydrolase [Erysipelotrichaceae bacterium]
MKFRVRFKLVLLVLMLVGAAACMFMANNIQHSDNTVKISDGKIKTQVGDLTYKLYVPDSASQSAKAPAVLLLHGYQNDHETCAAYAIELSRRGYVVLSLDEYGHGSSKAGLANRGYVNHKVTVNYGNDSTEDGTYVEIGGVDRYKIMMNFSNLSFFNDHYSKDGDGNSITDSSCGGIDAYKYLSELPYVDNTKMALSGHSMGTWSSWTVAAAYSGTPIEPVATVLQCGELFRDSVYDPSIHFNNVLL